MLCFLVLGLLVVGRDPDAAPHRRPDPARTLYGRPGRFGRYLHDARAGDRAVLDLPVLDLPVLDLPVLDLPVLDLAVLVSDQVQQPQARVPVEGRVMGVEDQGVPPGPAGEQQPERR